MTISEGAELPQGKSVILALMIRIMKMDLILTFKAECR